MAGDLEEVGGELAAGARGGGVLEVVVVQALARALQGGAARAVGVVGDRQVWCAGEALYRGLE